jgi:ADP-ribose pyrophosphatase YjhB (NUDIX family)
MTPIRYPDWPLIGIGVVVWREDEVLLVKRKNPPAQGQWALPGGKQQVGETLFAAAIREVREETGVAIDPLHIVTALDAITKDASGKVEYHYTLVEVGADWVSGEARAADDALAVRWASPDEVAALCAWPEVARVVRLSMLQRIL